MISPSIAMIPILASRNHRPNIVYPRIIYGNGNNINKEQRFKVYYRHLTKYGYIESNIKKFYDLKKADFYAKKLIRDLKDFPEESEGEEGVIILDTITHSIIRVYRKEEGKIVYV